MSTNIQGHIEDHNADPVAHYYYIQLTANPFS